MSKLRHGGGKIVTGREVLHGDGSHYRIGTRIGDGNKTDHKKLHDEATAKFLRDQIRAEEFAKLAPPKKLMIGGVWQIPVEERFKGWEKWGGKEPEEGQEPWGKEPLDSTL